MASIASVQQYPIPTQVFSNRPEAITHDEATAAYSAFKAEESEIPQYPMVDLVEGPFTLAVDGRKGYRSRTDSGGLRYAHCHWVNPEGTGKPHGKLFRAGRQNTSFRGGHVDLAETDHDHPQGFTKKRSRYSTIGRKGIETLGDDKFRVISYAPDADLSRAPPSSPGTNLPLPFTVTPVKIPRGHDFYSYDQSKGGGHAKDRDENGNEVTYFQDGPRSGTVGGANFEQGSYQVRPSAVKHGWRHFERNGKPLTEHSMRVDGIDSVVEVPRGTNNATADGVLSTTGFWPIPRN